MLVIMVVFSTTSVINKVSFLERLKKDIIRNKGLYLLLVPVVVYYIVFHYYPMYGAQIAFKNYSPAKGIEGSSWVGFKHFKSFGKDDQIFLPITKLTLAFLPSPLQIGRGLA